MDSDSILNNRLETCFKSIANGECHKLDMYFVRKTLQVYKHNVVNKDEHSLQNLTSFLQFCEKGRWTDASSLLSAARKEYDREYPKKESSQHTGQASSTVTREVNDRRHPTKGVDEKHFMMRSKDASIRLMDNNPNIFDLSDPNNPIKLAERFSELYNNEYTDAFEELNKTSNHPDERIKFLLDIVKKAVDFCMKERKQMIDDQMKSAGIPPNDHVKRFDKLMDLRRHAKEKLASVRERFMKSQTKDMREMTRKYVIQCVEIVWLMCIQQPPVYLEWVESKGEKFNPELYRAYTRSGNFVEFCVWPVVRLHKDGPILTRGISQGCD